MDRWRASDVILRRMVGRATRLLFIALLVAMAVLAVLGARHGWSGGVVTALAVLLLAHPAVLAIEGLMLRRVSRRVNGVRLAWGTLVRAWWREWGASSRTFGWRLPWRSQAFPDHLPASARGRRGVVLVHGFVCNRGLWNPWLERLRALDRAVVAVSLEPVFGEIDGYAASLEAALRRIEAATGLAPLVVAHSMGGLVVRAWLRAYAAQGAAERVARVITIGTPHRGTWIAGWSMAPNARQMRMGCTWMEALGRGEAASPAGLFVCWWSECDQIVFPPPTAVLPGAEARQLAGVGHLALVDREEIWSDVVARLDAAP
jgi:pimeloyl-ACP methyl ester carboxylesterase